MGSLFNVMLVVSSSVFKMVIFFVPEGIVQREKAIKSFKKDVPVWMDEEYL